MKLQRPGYAAGIALTATLALSACGSDNIAPAAPGGSASAAVDCGSAATLNAQGSSAQKNAMSEWIKAYQTRCPDVKINYEPSGSGAGIQAFIAGTADFAGSDSALKPEEQPKADAKCAGGAAIHLPMVIGPIAVVYNLGGVDKLQLKPTTIAKIFAGTVTTWNAPEIAADNPGVSLPGTTIQTVHRSDESGTTENFTSFLDKTAKADWTFGKAKAWKAPGGRGEKGSDGIASAVKSAEGAISYVELSFAENSNLKMSKVANGAGEFVALTGEAAGRTIASAKVEGTGNDLKLSIDYNTKAAGAYPLVLVTYEIACSKGSPADKVPAIKNFLTYTASTAGQAELGKLGYAPLPAEVRAKVETAAAAIS